MGSWNKITILLIKTRYLAGAALENVKKRLDVLDEVLDNLFPVLATHLSCVSCE